MQELCKELPGVWSWDTDIPFADIIEYLESDENDKSKNLKIAYTASHFYQYCPAYGLSDDRKLVVQALYRNKQPLNNQQDLDRSVKHFTVFANDGHYVEEALLQEFGPVYGLQYYNDTHSGLGRILSKQELREPDFKNQDGYTFEAKMCWETTASKFPGEATLDYTIDPSNFVEKDFLDAFNELPQVKALHTAPLCLCLVKKRATFGYVVGVHIENNKGVKAKLIGPLSVKFLRAKQKYI